MFYIRRTFKIELMKIILTKCLLASFLSLVMLCSCNKYATVLVCSNKLISKQALVNPKPTQNVQQACNTAVTASETVAPGPAETAAPIAANASAAEPKKASAKHFMKSFPKMVANEIHQQTVAVSNVLQNHHIASYSGSQKTTGFLGIAGICLIIALALAVLGFTKAGTLFWQLSAILIIAAVVFLLLYLISKAASPKSE